MAQQACPECKALNDSAAAFCTTCGRAIVAQAPVTTQLPPQPAQTTPVQQVYYQQQPQPQQVYHQPQPVYPPDTQPQPGYPQQQPMAQPGYPQQQMVQPQAMPYPQQGYPQQPGYPQQQGYPQQPMAQPYPQQPYPQQMAQPNINVVVNNTAAAGAGVAPGAVIINRKSVGVALLLTFFFGPLGMLYSTVVGGIVMFLVSTVLAFFTLGLSLLITWPICLIWAAVAANSHNNATVVRVG